MESPDSHNLQLKMWLEENRLKTFKSWPFQDSQSCSKHKLAESGFYYIGNEEEPDSVKCFLCSKSLDGWDAEDDPWEEHLKHAPYCTFAQLRQPEIALTTEQLINFYKEQHQNVLNKALAEFKTLLGMQSSQLIKKVDKK